MNVKDAPNVLLESSEQEKKLSVCEINYDVCQSMPRAKRRISQEKKGAKNRKNRAANDKEFIHLMYHHKFEKTITSTCL